MNEAGDDVASSEPWRDGAQAVRRTLSLLRLVAAGQERGLRLTDITRMSGLSQPTVHRLLKALVDETAVEQDPRTRRYMIGPELLLFGLARARRLRIGAVAEPYLRALADQVGDTAFLSLRQGGDSVCIARHLGSHQIQVLSIDVGARRPLGASVSGVALLSAMPPDEIRALTEANAKRLSLQRRTVQDVVDQALSARELGYAYAPQGVTPGTSAVAVPLRDANGVDLAAISIAALSNRLGSKQVSAVVAQMHEQARLIAARHAEIERSRSMTR